MYRIRFSNYSPFERTGKIRDECDGLSCHRVYTHDVDVLMSFMKQHNFDMNMINVETLSDNYDNDDIELHLLKPYQMKSNRTGKVYQIYSTDYFIYDAVEMIVMGLSNYLVFGEVIFNQEIQFIKSTTEIIEELPYLFIFDFEMMDGGPLTDSRNYIVKKSTMEDFESHENMDYPTSMDELSSRFSFNVVHDKPLPITIEAYIRYFIKNVILKTMKGY